VPGPARLYELLLFAAIYISLFHFFSKSGFTISVITALTVCAAFFSAVLRTDLSAEDWSTLNQYTIWIIRVCALAAEYWLFSAAPTTMVRYVAVLVYAALYVVSENAAWRRKAAIEAAAKLQP